jgi:hypothetical protein
MKFFFFSFLRLRLCILFHCLSNKEDKIINGRAEMTSRNSKRSITEEEEEEDDDDDDDDDNEDE